MNDLGISARAILVPLWPFACLYHVLPPLETVKKSIRLREEALQKDQGTVKSGQTSADKLRKILKEEKR